MTLSFTMHAGYETREVELVLSRDGRKGWRFYGRDKNGYLVLATDVERGKTSPWHRTKHDAQMYASPICLDYPAYAVWSPHKRTYDGEGAKFIAKARDAQ